MGNTINVSKDCDSHTRFNRLNEEYENLLKKSPPTDVEWGTFAKELFDAWNGVRDKCIPRDVQKANQFFNRCVRSSYKLIDMMSLPKENATWKSNVKNREIENIINKAPPTTSAPIMVQCLTICREAISERVTPTTTTNDGGLCFTVYEDTTKDENQRGWSRVLVAPVEIIVASNLRFHRTTPPNPNKVCCVIAAAYRSNNNKAPDYMDRLKTRWRDILYVFEDQKVQVACIGPFGLGHNDGGDPHDYARALSDVLNEPTHTFDVLQYIVLCLPAFNRNSHYKIFDRIMKLKPMMTPMVLLTQSHSAIDAADAIWRGNETLTVGFLCPSHGEAMRSGWIAAGLMTGEWYGEELIAMRTTLGVGCDQDIWNTVEKRPLPRTTDRKIIQVLPRTSIQTVMVKTYFGDAYTSHDIQSDKVMEHISQKNKNNQTLYRISLYSDDTVRFNWDDFTNYNLTHLHCDVPQTKEAFVSMFDKISTQLKLKYLGILIDKELAHAMQKNFSVEHLCIMRKQPVERDGTVELFLNHAKNIQTLELHRCPFSYNRRSLGNEHESKRTRSATSSFC